MRFNFTGNIGLGTTPNNLPFKKGKTKSGDEYKSFTCSILAGKNNRGYIEMFGSKPKDGVIYTRDKDNNKIEITWADRDDENVIEQVASYKKFIVNLSGEFGNYDSFITQWDVIDYLENNIEEIKDKTITVTGNVVKNIYNGKITNRFQFTNIYLANDDTLPKLQVTADIYWRAEDVDTKDWKTEKKIYIDGYTKEYINKAEGIKFVPQQLIYDASKVDFNNPDHVMKLNVNLASLNLTYKDETIKNLAKKNEVYHVLTRCNYINGTEEVPFDIECLTPAQRARVDAGLNKLEDFKEGKVYGDRITQFKIAGFELKGEFADGAALFDGTLAEFNEQIYVPVVEETMEDFEKKVKAASAIDDDLDDDPLFG